MTTSTSFPNFCCMCLCPRPDGTWPIVSRYCSGGSYPVCEMTTIKFSVPMCSACRWDRRRRDLFLGLGTLGIGLVATVVAGVASAVAITSFGAPRGPYILLVVLSVALVAMIIAYNWLTYVLKTEDLKHVACTYGTLTLVDLHRRGRTDLLRQVPFPISEGGRIWFGNEEYHQLYTGQGRPAPQKEPNWDELPWR
jgi:hypothetical protein